MPGSATTPASVVRIGVVDSTQAAAFALAGTGAADGTAIVAHSQTRGRGRHGRVWLDEPGASLLVSVVVRPGMPPREWPRLSLAAGVAVAEALAGVAGLAARVRWPNDVLVEGRKVAGVLLEARHDAAPVVVVGVGVNLAQRSFPSEIAARATSVALETGRAPDREAVLGAFLDAFAAWRDRLQREGLATLRARWLALSDTVGRRVEVDGVTGTAVDLDGDGALVVRTADGGLRRVRAGEVAGAEG